MRSVVLAGIGLVLAILVAFLFQMAFDKIFGRRADLARLAGVWLLTFFALGLPVMAGFSGLADKGTVWFCVAVSVGMTFVAITQSLSYRSTHERRPRAHDSRRTQPDK